MKLIFIIPFLCLNLITSLKKTEVELAKKYQFDGEDKQFTLNYEGSLNNVLLLQIKCDNNIIQYEVKCPDYHMTSHINHCSETEEIFTQQSSGMCTFNFTGKGNFIVYSFKESVTIDLKDTYGNVDLEAKEILKLTEPYHDLTFSFNNFESDIIAYFNYNKEKISINDEYYDIKNPFKICVNETCEKGNIQEYNFIKNNTYKIIVQIQAINDKNGKTHYVFPGFSFPKKINIIL